MGDFDGDGNQDIVLSLHDQGAIGIFFGRGDGTFDPFVSYSAAVDPTNVLPVQIGTPPTTALAVVGLDGTAAGQGHLVIIGISDQREEILVASLALGVDLWSGEASIADLNRDGIPDFIVAVDEGSAFLDVLLSDADGGWQEQGSVAQFSYNNGFIGDFNEDGVADVVGIDPANSPAPLSLFLGNGDGTFGSGVVVDPGTTNTVYIFAAGDLNGDGLLDLLVSDESRTDYGWTPYLGAGNGTFVQGTPATLGSALWGLQLSGLSDIDGDGHLDYVGVQFWQSLVAGANLGYALGNGDGTFQNWVTIFGFDGGVGGLVIGDVNNDGRPDVIVSDPDSTQLSVFLNNGGGKR